MRRQRPPDHPLHQPRYPLPDHVELEREREHVRRARQRLEDTIARTTTDLRTTFGEATTHRAGQEDRDAIANQGAVRLRALRAGSGPLCFGRIDLRLGESLVIGRTGVSDDDFEPLVVDWRAPAAAPFYRATGPEPLGVVRRRHFLWRHDVLVSLDDEVFDRAAAAREGLELVGEAALLDALSRSRSDRMGDIVATIQRDQHEVIHAPLSGTVVVQGGPGTGKTAVALHRAAYLLYAHRFPLESSGVLFVGPSVRFLRYVGDVLPSLGETAVHMSTVDQLVDGVTAIPGADRRAETIKHDARMAAVLAAAVADRERPLRVALRIPHGATEIVLPAKATGYLIDALRTAGGTHNDRAAMLPIMVLDALKRRFVRAEERLMGAGLRGTMDTVELEEIDAFVRSARSSEALRIATNRMWPQLDGEQLVDDLLSSPVLLRSAAAHILHDDEIEVLLDAWGRQATPDGREWTSADVALVDEASALLGPRVHGRRAARDQLTAGEQFDIDQVLAQMPDLDPVVRADIAARLGDQARLARNGGPKAGARHDRWRTYGHVVVDEAQDLSPMQWRMIARRGATRSYTVVGDLAQGTTGWAPREWSEVTDHLTGPAHSPVRTVDLRVGYRTPLEVMDLAAPVLERSASHLRAPHSVRRAGHPPTFVNAEQTELMAAASATAHALRSELGEGTVAIIAAPGHECPENDARISLLSPLDAKGLEFDAVVVVEPAEMVDGERGYAQLYIALTRTTDRLVIVHAADLPPELDRSKLDSPDVDSSTRERPALDRLSLDRPDLDGERSSSSERSA